jgi:hypothetical protein
MDEFFHRERLAMSQNESPKIEPTLSLVNSPSIAPAADAAATPSTESAPTIEITAEEIAPRSEAAPSLPPAPKLDAPEPQKIELKSEPQAEKSEPRFEAKLTRMPALRKDEPAGGPEIVVKPRVGRFALLAASVAIAASFGAVGGSLGVAKFGPMFASAPVPAPVVKDHTADEVKALKDTVAQLRGTTKSLSESLAALKTSMNASNTAQNVQIGKLAETLDRVEKTQAESRKAAQAQPHPAAQTAAAGNDVTGSIARQKAPVPMVLGEPPQNLRPPVVQGWVLRRVYDGAALIEGRDGIIEVEPGVIAPGLGRIEGIRRQDGRWVVVTARGIVVGR